MLKIIQSCQEIEQAWSVLEMADEYEEIKAAEYLWSSIVHRELNIWMSRLYKAHPDNDPENPCTHIVKIFGVTPIKNINNIVVQINIATEHGGRREGYLATDGSTRWICHTGTLGGGKPRITRNEFVEWLAKNHGGKWRLEQADCGDGKNVEIIRVAEVGSPQMLKQLADYVLAVQEFRQVRHASGDGYGVMVSEGSQINIAHGNRFGDVPGVCRKFLEGERRRRNEACFFVRDHELAKRLKNESDGCCQICMFDTKALPENMQNRVLECHHLNPLASRDGKMRQTLPEDVVVLCSNCHRMVHASEPPLSVSQLRDLLRERNLIRTSS